MKTLWGEIRRGLLGLPRDQTNYIRRGFSGATPQMQSRLEQIGEAFRQGCNRALEQNSQEGLVVALSEIEAELRGFAYEGAALGLALLDTLTPWRPSRVPAFLRGPGQAHAYVVHVGVGWVWARLPMGIQRTRKRLEPLLSWLAFDGWGFHEGFFHWRKYLSGKPAPRRVEGYGRRVFDQGLGRSLWFVKGGNPELLAQTIRDFPTNRQADLWSGLGLAATYAGIVEAEVLEALLRAAGPYRQQLAQGAAFAAKARQRASNATDYTERASRAFCGMSVEEAARLCDTTLENLPASGPVPAYEIWRQRIQQQLVRSPQLREA